MPSTDASVMFISFDISGAVDEAIQQIEMARRRNILLKGVASGKPASDIFISLRKDEA